MFRLLRYLLGEGERIEPKTPQVQTEHLVDTDKTFKYLQFLYKYSLIRKLNYPILDDSEINIIETEWGIKLPEVFREFFKIIGKYGIFFYGCNEFQTH